ncbi:alpha/beta hydrolase [Sulfuritalea hydrogenivorans]|jgi:non-heme chloroperoxidase|nr:alpha/beta fold hydrolase [Sulfuritalea hydrogenivorans]MDK9715656.1 lysophospholipase [Sulfuritalea sp.]
MNPPRFEHHEVLVRMPAGKTQPTPLLFVHGAYTAAWCWEEHFLPFFAEAGYAAYAVSLSGHGGSPGRKHLDSFSIGDYVRDVAAVAAALPAPPVLIGHSMGGFVVQKYLEEHIAPGAVLMCAVPPQGLLSAAMGMMFSKPGMMKDLNSLMSGGKASLETLREALFAQPVSLDDLKRYYKGSQSESHRAIWDMSLFGMPRAGRVKRTPLLVQGAEFDHLIPASLVEMTARTYDVDAHVFPGMGHGLMLERDWKKPAQQILDWLRELEG